MVEMIIKVDETTVNVLGKQVLEQQIQEYVQKLLVKKAAQEALADLDNFVPANDPKWQLARTRAWEIGKEQFRVYLEEAKKQPKAMA